VRAEVHGVDLGEVSVDVEHRRGRSPDVPQLDLALVSSGQVLAGSTLPTNLRKDQFVKLIQCGLILTQESGCHF